MLRTATNFKVSTPVRQQRLQRQQENVVHFDIRDQIKMLLCFKDTVMQIEKALINDRLRVSKVY